MNFIFVFYSDLKMEEYRNRGNSTSRSDFKLTFPEFQQSTSRQAATERVWITNNPKEKTISVTKTYRSGSCESAK